jgi:hypothetical protein
MLGDARRAVNRPRGPSDPRAGPSRDLLRLDYLTLRSPKARLSRADSYPSGEVSSQADGRRRWQH